MTVGDTETEWTSFECEGRLFEYVAVPTTHRDGSILQRLMFGPIHEAVLTRPARFFALAVTALRRGEMSVGRFAEYAGVTRQAAMRYVEQEPDVDEEIELPAA